MCSIRVFPIQGVLESCFGYSKGNRQHHCLFSQLETHFGAPKLYWVSQIAGTHTMLMYLLASLSNHKAGVPTPRKTSHPYRAWAKLCTNSETLASDDSPAKYQPTLWRQPWFPSGAKRISSIHRTLCPVFPRRLSAFGRSGESEGRALHRLEHMFLLVGSRAICSGESTP